MLLSAAGIAMSADSETMEESMKNEKDQDHERQAEFARLATSGKVAEAIAAYDHLSDPVRTGAVFRLAYFELLLDSGKLDKAVSLGREIEKDFPYTGRVLCAWGVQKIRLGNLEEGKKLLQRAIAVDPWYAQSYYELAKVSTEREDSISLCSRGLLMSRGNKELTASLTQLLSQRQSTK